MYESRIAAGHLTVAVVEGFPPEINTLAARNLAGYSFLRAAWYAASAPARGRTLLLRRGGAGSALLAAIPTIALGPPIGRARKVPGSYWPLRAPLIAPDCHLVELAHGLAHGAARCLGPVWRVGPLRSDDPATRLLVAAAQLAGWSVLSRPAGTAWVIDCDAARARGRPGPRTARKLARTWQRLEALGTPRWHCVRGSSWDSRALVMMGRIEAQSWIGRSTNGSGAKFMTVAQRGLWQRVLGDPLIAEMLCAVILLLDDRPISFSFDLDDGPVRYGIAGGYVEDLKHLGIGKLAIYRALEDAMAGGRRLFDLGVGDSGYKQAMGAARAYEMADLLFVRSRAAARVLAQVWGKALAPDSQAATTLPHGLAHG
jgi:CelD/BcsL family acetyltransferase involved in cellulose biosynthesis